MAGSWNRTGRVSNIDYKAGTYEVTYFDRGKSVTRKINAMLTSATSRLKTINRYVCGKLPKNQNGAVSNRGRP